MRILIVGASKGIGLEAVRQALASGHDVRALARSAEDISVADPKLAKIRGDALNKEDVEAALTGVDAVVLTLGIGLSELFKPVNLFSTATRVLIDAMKAQGVNRLVCVTGFGAGDSQVSISPLQRIPFNIVFGRAYEDKSRQEKLIKESSLDWTIVRPGVLMNGPKTGRYKILRKSSEWRNGIVSRANVADFLVREIDEANCLHETPVLVN